MNISVVIPLYNKELYIRRTIESVLSQNTPPEEILVIDDGSTDSSAQVVRNIKDSRIRLIQQINSGEGAARNHGVAEAKNQLVAFLDADDEWKPDFLTNIQMLVNNFPDCGAYATSYEIVSSDTGIIFNPPIIGLLPAPWIGIIPNLFEVLQSSLPFFPSSIAFPKKAYYDLGGFPEGIKRGCDTMMWIRLGIKYPIAYSPSRQAIYHTEAENRACVIFPSEGAAVKAQLMEKMLKDKEVPIDLLKSFKDYYANMHIRKASELIKEGKQKLARSYLLKVKKNYKHHREWVLWNLLSYSPTWFVKILVRLKRQLS